MAMPAMQDLPDRFIEIACLCYGDPHFDHRSFHARAHAMLRENPWLAEANIWSASAAGNARAVEALLNGDPELVNHPGPHGWAPLICACYSRVKPAHPAHSTFEVAKLLLERGADANAFTMKGNADERLDQTPRRYTALAGLVGGGSTGFANQPPHPCWRELAEILLDTGRQRRRRKGARPQSERVPGVLAPARIAAGRDRNGRHHADGARAGSGGPARESGGDPFAVGSQCAHR